MKYVIYYDRKGDGKLGEMVGTEGCLCPDQRYCIRTLIDKVLNKEFIVPSRAVAFTINIGTIFNNRPYTKMIYLWK